MVSRLDQSTIEGALKTRGAPSSDFDLNPSLKPSDVGALTPAGVLVPLLNRPSGISVLLTKRSANIRQHAGQIAFPGGKVDPDDKSYTDAALREAHEEVGLSPANVRVLGHLPSHTTVTRYEMYPVVGWVNDKFDMTLQEQEVSEAFEVPLRHILDVTQYTARSRLWEGRERHYLTIPYGPHYIWGATARVLRAFAERMSAL